MPSARERTNRSAYRLFYLPSYPTGHLIVLAVILALLCLAVALRGVVLGGDSGIYREAAQRLLEGRPLTGVQSAYAGYAFVVASVDWLGLGLVGVVVVQLLMATIAALCLYRFGSALGDARTGLLAASVFLLNPDIARWHSYVLTESLYTSLVVLSAWAVWRASELGGYGYLGALVSVIAASLVRPTGWLLVPVAMSFLVWGRTRNRVATGASAIVGLVAVAAVVAGPFLTERVAAADPAAKIREGVVIPNYERLAIGMPSDPEDRSSGLGAAIGFAVRHPLATARLALTRVGVEFAGVRPHYSTRHNLFLAGLLGLLYPTAVIGAIKAGRSRILWIALSVIGAHVAFVAAAFASYDGRFLDYALPLMGLLAARAFFPPGAGQAIRDSKASSVDLPHFRD